MTRAARYEEVLEKRARALARVAVDEREEGILATVVVLRIADEQVGIRIDALSEIVPLRSVAALPGLPHHLRGMTHVRGTLLSVLDLSRWLGLSGTSSPRYLAVLNGAPGKIAVLVDAVLDVRDVTATDLAASFGHSDAERGRPVFGTTRDLVTLLDAEQLFQSKSLLVGAQSSEEADPELGPMARRSHG